jgi:hypothetical protein
MRLRFNNIPFIALFFRPRHLAAEHDGAPFGAQNFLARDGCDFRRFGGKTSFSFW